MQKKLIALALASAFAAPAFAATANVDIGGTMAFSIDSLNADSVNNGRNTNISSNASNIFFKGTEDLGGGLKAIWQVQTYFSAGGTGNTDTQAGGVADGVGSGNTFVGLSGGFGTVILGKNESPVKMLSRKVDFFNNQIGDSRNLTTDAYSIAATSTTAAPAAAGVGFDTRPNNMIAYVTPDFSGFSATVGYFSNFAAGAATNTSVDGYAAAGTYDNGPLFLGLGYEKHNSAMRVLLVLTGDENVWRLAAGYTIGDFKVTGLYQKTNDNGGVNGADRRVWGLGAGYNIGAILVKASYYDAGDLNSVANTGAKMYAVGADYSLSKRTKLQLAYAQTENDSAAKHVRLRWWPWRQPLLGLCCYGGRQPERRFAGYCPQLLIWRKPISRTERALRRPFFLHPCARRPLV